MIEKDQNISEEISTQFTNAFHMFSSRKPVTVDNDLERILDSLKT